MQRSTVWSAVVVVRGCCPMACTLCWAQSVCALWASVQQLLVFEQRSSCRCSYRVSLVHYYDGAGGALQRALHCDATVFLLFLLRRSS
jgi:hypothetical protein